MFLEVSMQWDSTRVECGPFYRGENKSESLLAAKCEWAKVDDDEIVM